MEEFAALARLLLQFTGSDTNPPSRRLRELAAGAQRMSLAQVYQEVSQRARTADSTASTLAEVLGKAHVRASGGSRSCSPDVMDFLRSERKDLRPENLALSFSPSRDFVRPRRPPARPLSAQRLRQMENDSLLSSARTYRQRLGLDRPASAAPAPGAPKRTFVPFEGIFTAARDAEW